MRIAFTKLLSFLCTRRISADRLAHLLALWTCRKENRTLCTAEYLQINAVVFITNERNLERCLYQAKELMTTYQQ